MVSMNFKDFIIEAKKRGYAGNGKYRKLLDGRKEFVYQNDEFKYIDRYIGFSNIMGQELVFSDGKIIWSMNYHGSLCPFSLHPLNPDVETTEEDVYEFLKECLKMIPEEKPFRGPEEFENENLIYVNKIDGFCDETNFNGEERIFLKSGRKDPIPVYRLLYNGGYVDLENKENLPQQKKTASKVRIKFEITKKWISQV